VLYLFLRGMCGPSVAASGGTVPGVFAWRPPAALVVAASDALDRGSAT
jgi:exodeoxyribonuclease V beta subunit